LFPYPRQQPGPGSATDPAAGRGGSRCACSVSGCRQVAPAAAPPQRGESHVPAPSLRGPRPAGGPADDRLQLLPQELSAAVPAGRASLLSGRAGPGRAGAGECGLRARLLQRLLRAGHSRSERPPLPVRPPFPSRACGRVCRGHGVNPPRRRPGRCPPAGPAHTLLQTAAALPAAALGTEEAAPGLPARHAWPQARRAAAGCHPSKSGFAPASFTPGRAGAAVPPPPRGGPGAPLPHREGRSSHDVPPNRRRDRRRRPGPDNGLSLLPPPLLPALRLLLHALLQALLRLDLVLPRHCRAAARPGRRPGRRPGPLSAAGSPGGDASCRHGRR